MAFKTRNIFTGISFPAGGEELFESIIENENIKIERIVSQGQISPDGFWYNQPLDEWVILLNGNAVIVFEDEVENHLNVGDYLFIPAHTLHRVTFTSISPPCIWLAVHGNLSDKMKKY